MDIDELSARQINILDAEGNRCALLSGDNDGKVGLWMWRGDASVSFYIAANGDIHLDLCSPSNGDVMLKVDEEDGAGLVISDKKNAPRIIIKYDAEQKPAILLQETPGGDFRDLANRPQAPGAPPASAS